MSGWMQYRGIAVPSWLTCIMSTPGHLLISPTAATTRASDRTRHVAPTSPHLAKETEAGGQGTSYKHV